jgi:hypothetical protein
MRCLWRLAELVVFAPLSRARYERRRARAARLRRRDNHVAGTRKVFANHRFGCRDAPRPSTKTGFIRRMGHERCRAAAEPRPADCRRHRRRGRDGQDAGSPRFCRRPWRHPSAKQQTTRAPRSKSVTAAVRTMSPTRILWTDKFRCSSAVRPFNSPDRPPKFRCSSA